MFASVTIALIPTFVDLAKNLWSQHKRTKEVNNAIEKSQKIVNAEEVFNNILLPSPDVLRFPIVNNNNRAAMTIKMTPITTDDVNQ